MAKLTGDQISLLNHGYFPDFFFDQGDPGWDNIPDPNHPRIAEQHSAKTSELAEQHSAICGHFAEQHSASSEPNCPKIAEQHSAKDEDITERYSVSAILATLELLTPGELAKVINRSLRVQNDRDGKPDAGHVELKQRGNSFYRYLRYWEGGKLKCKYLGKA